LSTEPNNGNLNMTQQFSGLFQQINGKEMMANGLASLNSSQITSPHNFNHQAIISQFSGGPLSMLQSPHQPVKQTP